MDAVSSSDVSELTVALDAASSGVFAGELLEIPFPSGVIASVVALSRACTPNCSEATISLTESSCARSSLASVELAISSFAAAESSSLARRSASRDMLASRS